MRCPARPACPSSPITGSQGGRWSVPKLEPPKPAAVPADGKRSPWSLCTLAYRAFPARSASPKPVHHVRGIGDTASRCRIGHLPFPVHSRRLRWTLSGLRPGRAAYLAGLTTMTSCFCSRGRPAAGAMAMLQPCATRALEEKQEAASRIGLADASCSGNSDQKTETVWPLRTGTVGRDVHCTMHTAVGSYYMYDTSTLL